MSELSRLPRAELDRIITDPETPILTVSVARALTKAADEGATDKLNFVLERTIGKVKEEVVMQTESLDLQRRQALARAVLANTETAEAAALIARTVAAKRLEAAPKVVEGEVVERADAKEADASGRGTGADPIG